MNKQNNRAFNGSSDSIDKETILKLVLNYTGFDKETLLSKTRKREIINARHVFSWLALNYAKNATSVGVGKFIGKDHATVLHSCKVVDNAVFSGDRALLELFRPLETRVTTHLGDLENNIEGKTAAEMLNDLVTNNLITEKHKNRIINAIKNEK